MNNEKKSINYFFIGLHFVIINFFIIIVGGLTRLTNLYFYYRMGIICWHYASFKLRSGTNIELYKQIPQYKLLNFNMSLDDFKIIFYWEYFHRILARIIGLFFLIFNIFFIYKKN